MVTATVTGPPARVAEFVRVFGSDTVPVKSPVPHAGRLPGLGRREVYAVDVDALDERQRERLVAYGVERFGLTRSEAEHELAENGFPILASDTIVAVSARLVL